MGLLGLAVAAYAYDAQADDELSVVEGEQLYLEELVDQEWYRARRRHVDNEGHVLEHSTDTGLVPANYVEPAPPLRTVYAQYDYQSQNEDELSFREGDQLGVYEVDDAWLLASLDQRFGLIPANYVDDAPVTNEAADMTPVTTQGAYAGDTANSEVNEPVRIDPPAPAITAPRAVPMPPVAAPASEVTPMRSSAPTNEMLPPPTRRTNTKAATSADPGEESDGERMTGPVPVSIDKQARPLISDEMQMWSVTELDAKKKKRKAKGTLGIGNGALFFATDTNGASVPQIEIRAIHDAELENAKTLVLHLSGTAQVDHDQLLFHVGNKRAGDAILAKIQASKQAVREAMGDSKASGIPTEAKQPLSVSTSPPNTEQDVVVVLYDFEAQGDDELTVSEHDQLVLIEKENEEWWKLQNAAGAIGVVPAAYVEILDPVQSPIVTYAGRDLSEKIPAQRTNSMLVSSTSKGSTARGTSKKEKEPQPAAQRVTSSSALRTKKSPTRTGSGSASRDGQSLSRSRTWVDATGRFRVDAELVAVRQDSVCLLKSNGSKIDVPFARMSDADLEFLEQLTGRNLVMLPSQAMHRGDSQRAKSRMDYDKDRSDAKRGAASSKSSSHITARGQSSRASKPKPLDWFEFFLEAGVDVDNCTRYAAAFEKDHMDESVLEEVDAGMLRNLGLREGDVIRVRRLIDRRLGRSSGMASSARDETRQQSGRESSPEQEFDTRSEKSEERRMREDEELARRLQAQEITAQRRNTSGSNVRASRPTQPSASTTTRESSALDRRPKNEEEIQREATSLVQAEAREQRGTIDAETLARAVELVREREKKDAEEAKKASASSQKKDTSSQVPSEKPERVADPESALFDKLAKMKPSPTNTGSPSMNGGMGFNAPMTMGPRAPYAPVPSNQGLLQPLIPLQGTGQIVPTGTGAWPMQGQATGYGYGGGMHVGMPTGMPTGMPSQMPASPFAGGQLPMMPTSSMGNSTTGGSMPRLGQATVETTNEPQDQFSAANVFQQMKTGAFAQNSDAKPQSSGKYDALRAQPTGFAAGGIVDNQWGAGSSQQQMPSGGMPGIPMGYQGWPTGMAPNGTMMSQPTSQYWP